MKKIIIMLITIAVFCLNSISFATEQDVLSNSERPVEIIEAQEIESEFNETDETKKSESTIEEKADNKQVEINNEEKATTPASKKIIQNVSKKDAKIAEYTKKYNDKTFAYTAYYLDLIQLYSIPVCIIGITIGAFNFYIIGEKKLDKREKGFSFIMAFLSGLVFFQVLPLIFALLVAGK